MAVERRCGKEALDLVYWPGQERPVPMCAAHAEWARSVSRAIGFSLAIQASALPQTCTQIIHEPRGG